MKHLIIAKSSLSSDDLDILKEQDLSEIGINEEDIVYISVISITHCNYYMLSRINAKILYNRINKYKCIVD